MVAEFSRGSWYVAFGMAFSTFLTEPPLPRTEFRVEPEMKAEENTDAARNFEQAMVNVLINFPEAYHAVVDEMRRLDAEEKKGPPGS